MRPSFGACAPPSPNSARNLYFLRRVGRHLMIIQARGDLSRRLAPLSPKWKAFTQSVKTFNDNSGNRRPLSALCATLPEGESFSAECEDFLFFRLGFWIETAKSVPTRRKCLPFRGRCRHYRRKRTLPSHSADFIMSFRLNWGKCLRRDLFLIK